jgi:hypothetical protein
LFATQPSLQNLKTEMTIARDGIIRQLNGCQEKNEMAMSYQSEFSRAIIVLVVSGEGDTRKSAGESAHFKL